MHTCSSVTVMVWTALAFLCILHCSTSPYRHGRWRRETHHDQDVEVDDYPDTDMCGVSVRKCKLIDRIVGGGEAVPHCWPWQLQLLLRGKHYCGATLIAPNWAITAAHCTYLRSADDLLIVAGQHNRNVNDGSAVVHTVAEVIAHYGYVGEQKKWADDLALLRLTEPVTYNTFVRPICINFEHVADDDECYTTGWGKISAEAKNTSMVLNQVRVMVSSMKVCRVPYDNYLPNTTLCAGNSKRFKGTCAGDSGGPLMCQKGEFWVLAGVTSFGRGGCVSPTFPTVYTNISCYLDWITKRTNTNWYDLYIDSTDRGQGDKEHDELPAKPGNH